MVDNSTVKGLEQARAKFAYDKAQVISKTGGKKAKEYKAYAKKLPMMIKSNGLGAALSFVFSKSKNKEGNKTSWGLLYDDLNSWLRQEHKKWLLGETPSDDLSEAAINLNSPDYRALCIEILAFLNWLRRFAEGLIEGEADENV
ncbi:MAG: type III-B CRISPR module-associated protein Cmr5 [Saprospiraceae bacterium]|nr:type III-B CRISPR module-associated protein Cmr5 [Saprospiraceae bacterium]